ncbi:MAG: cytochrome b/b6 domain-containing protein [Magnetospirillum sp.]|nr:cytochrome b/b6 domain-containing protein [Magnetospirillum sp.]
MLPSPRLVWDLPVRLFHWLLAASVVGAFVTNKLGVAWFSWHAWFGYAVIVLVSFRLVWGVVGTRHARFASFVRGPAAILAYLRGGAPATPGHNPLGALMVLALLAGLLTLAALGLFGNDDIINTGPLAGYVGKETSLLLTSYHRRLFYGIAAAVAVHVLAVLAHRVVKGENLVLPMITGRKPVADADTIPSSRPWLALTLVLVLAGALVLGADPCAGGRRRCLRLIPLLRPNKKGGRPAGRPLIVFRPG